MKLDFFARRPHYLDHMAPIYLALPAERRGTFTVPADLFDYARQELGEVGQLEIYDDITPRGDDPILVASYGDISRAARNRKRKIVHMEHGTGHAFGTAPYPNATRGKRDLVDLFLAPNEYTANLIRSVRSMPVEVIGTPKTDAWAHVRSLVMRDGVISPEREYVGFSTITGFPPQAPVVAIAFHWGDKNSKPPEAGSAFEHYKEILPELASRYKVIGHGHPLAAEFYQKEFEHAGIEWVADFRQVLRRADIYINDLSSTLYEFLTTGEPVIVLNAPWFRKEIHWGIRFWDYSDVGINVWEPDHIFHAIDFTQEFRWNICREERVRAVADLYPYLGNAAQRAADVLVRYLEEWEHQ